MSLLYIDGFDHYNDSTEADRKWDYRASDPSWTTGRFGGQAVYFNGGQRKLGKDIPNIQTVVVGFAWLHNSSNYVMRFLELYDGGTQQLALETDSLGHIRILRGGTTLETSAQTYIQGVWYYLELKATIDNSSGSYEFRVNGDTWFSDSGIDTQVSANAYVTQVRIGSSSSFNYPVFDDIYILDTSGSMNNDFLGDVKVETLYPDGAGNETDWTPSTGSNYQNVDETNPDNDTTYNYVGSGTLPANDLYTLGNLVTGVGEIYGIQLNSYVRKDDAGSVNLAHILRTGGTTYSGLGVNSVADTYSFYTDLKEENPNTTAQWTVAEINSLETGIRRVS